MSVSKRLRFEILRRDNHACRYCGATAAFFRELEPGVREWIEDDSPEPTKLGHMFPNMFGSANGAD